MSPAETARAKNFVLALLAMAQFVVVLDASIVNVALPSIGRALDFAQDDLSWVVNAYTLVFGGFLLLGGRLADLLGRRRMFVYGMWLFALASLVGGLAQSDVMLIAARATTSQMSLWARPPASDATANSHIPHTKIRRRPSRSASRPPSSRKPPKVST